MTAPNIVFKCSSKTKVNVSEEIKKIENELEFIQKVQKAVKNHEEEKLANLMKEVDDARKEFYHFNSLDNEIELDVKRWNLRGKVDMLMNYLERLYNRANELSNRKLELSSML